MFWKQKHAVIKFLVEANSGESEKLRHTIAQSSGRALKKKMK